MLETIREFGLELLALSGEEYEVRRRHAAWCLAIGEAAWADTVARVNVQAMLDRLESELGNIRAAMAWLEAHAPADALRLAGAIFWFCYVRGHLEEGSTWLERGLARADSAPVADRPGRCSARGCWPAIWAMLIKPPSGWRNHDRCTWS